MIDERTAPLLAAAIRLAWADSKAFASPADHPPYRAGLDLRGTRAASWALAGCSLLLGLWVGGGQTEDSQQLIAHAPSRRGSLTESPRRGHPTSGRNAATGAGRGGTAMRTSESMKAVMAGATISAAITAGSGAQDAVQWRVQDGGNGHWYEIRDEGAQPWTASRQRAINLGGHLATLTSAAESAFVASLKVTNRGIDLGGFQDRSAPEFSEPTGGWRWVTGEPWAFTNWLAGEPNDMAPSEDYLFFAQVNAWGDKWGDGGDFCPACEPHYFAVEWSADCNSDGIVDYGQIRAGQLPDANANNVPDSCECSSFPELPACRCVGDIVADRIVNGADLGALLSYWGPRTSGSFSIASDLNDNGTIDGADLGMLLSNWGECQPAAVIVPPWATLIEAAPDPTVVTDSALRTAIAATGLAWRVSDTGTGIEMLLVPPGSFYMGCSMGSDTLGCHAWELPVHHVTLTGAFYLGRYEVTQGQWVSEMGSNPSYFRFDSDAASRPVEQVSWNTVQNFLARTNLRLPTEAEWELACRAGTSTPYYNGSTDERTLGDLAWYAANSGNRTHSVGGRSSNGLGFHDMLGNVWEWSSDWWSEYPATSQVDPPGSRNGLTRVRRSSGWRDEEPNVRSSTRPNGGPDQGWDIGFRVARNP